MAEITRCARWYRVLVSAVAAGVLATGCWPVMLEEQIIDNKDTRCTRTGYWDTQTAVDGNGYWGSDFLYAYSVTGAANAATVRFTPTVPSNALYNIYIYWSAASNRTTAQPVVVHDANGGNTQYSVNLQQNGHGWYFLGQHVMGPGSHIEFSNLTNAAGYCNADAVRLTRCSPPESKC